jgi:hypothetical protein
MCAVTLYEVEKRLNKCHLNMEEHGIDIYQQYEISLFLSAFFVCKEFSTFGFTQRQEYGRGTA